MPCSGCAAVDIEAGAINCESCDVIKVCFNRGYPYDAIVELLGNNGIHISLSTLKRRLKRLGLKRKGNVFEEDQLRALITEEIQGPGQLSGYRGIWHALRLKHGVHVSRHVVGRLLREIDPDGVQSRKTRRLHRRTYTSKEANACWHLDGYDKLKPYGFAIHAAICGYSRRILWLEVLRSNNDPQIVAGIYLDFVKEVGGCSQRVRTDCGTENVILAGMQCYLRADGLDEWAGEKSHVYGSSPANQRIEAWWSFLRRNRSGWWIDLFQDMCQRGILKLGNVYHMECLWFCYSRIIQQELHNVKDQWNSHYIRKSQHETIAGIPDLLFFIPEYYGGENCLCEASHAKILELETSVQRDERENIYQEYFEYVCEMRNWRSPKDVHEAFEMFQQLVNMME